MCVFLTRARAQLFFLCVCCRGLCAVYRSRAGDTPGERQDNGHNAHWLAGGGQPSRHVGYYDAASLYPASSKSLSVP